MEGWIYYSHKKELNVISDLFDFSESRCVWTMQNLSWDEYSHFEDLNMKMRKNLIQT